MKKLPKFTLVHNDKKATWDLKKDESKRVVKRFETKQEATKGGVLKKAIGNSGGSVKIQKLDGDYEEERTYPRSRDPQNSKG